VNAPAHHDPYVTLPLQGVRLIEASAGSGKTFTLATLVLRLVIEQGLGVGQILAVTFTEAATQELRTRVRERLERAAAIAGEADAGDDSDAADALAREVIERHLAGGAESRAHLARRLRHAALETDLAAIFTIHGFCARVLREHALESGHAFEAPTLLTSDAALREELAADLWRSLAASPDADVLVTLWAGPAQLKDDLAALLAREPLRPEAGDAGGDPMPALHAAADALRDAFESHGEEFRAALEAASNAKILHAAGYKPDWIDKRWRELRDWCAAQGAGSLDESLERLTPDGLRQRTNKAGLGRTPQSPLCEAIAAFLAARGRVVAWQRARAVALLHRVRDDARTRLAALKQSRRLQTFDDLIDGVADALAGPHGDALAIALRARYRVALVDEFQDTDPRQWTIFHRVFGMPHGEDAPALFLIGDPKQAIYGFRGGDVHTYLQAEGETERAPTLDRNFRSRPAVLRALATLYAQAGNTAFVDSRIRFQPMLPGGRRADAEFLCDGGPAPGLTVRVIGRDPGAPDAIAIDAARARVLAARACVDAIHAVLRAGRDDRASIAGRAVAPGDIAVLVRSHVEATLMQRALAAVGISAVAAGRQSLYATDEARELLAVFEALLHPADDGRLRGVLATVLLGLDAAAIAALDDDGALHARYQQAAQDWRERWQRSGPFALVADLCAAAGARLLGLLDGERRLSNYLQLAEALQEAEPHAPSLHAQLDWLRSAIADADPDDEAQLLRLESDAHRVQIVTLHKSKGLEYPLVFLPFAAIGRKKPDPGNKALVHVDGVRQWRWKIDKESQDWKRTCEAFETEQRAEDARLLYVGLTRARDAVWLATGPFYNAEKTPLALMLRDLDTRCVHADIVIDATALPPPPAPLPQRDSTMMAPPRVAQRPLSGDWWVYSFTQLVRSEPGTRIEAAATASERGAEDEPALADATLAASDAAFGGSRFGNVLHDALEHVDFAAWRDWRGSAAPPGQDAALRGALLRGGYAASELDAGLAALQPLVAHTLTATLPEGGRLCDLPIDARRAEMEFHFALQPTTVERLLALLHAHDVLRDRQAFGARRRLEGLMTGKIDLTYQRDGRWYLLDYKSNRLAAYDRAGLYTLALHRWLRFRLGDAYDYARDVGGVRYLFCRGLAGGNGAGVHAWQPTPDLVHALDALFAGATP
jgi:exodeoxyribonuclease V beta subunit